jgi:anti-sigma B factor antagonist
MEIEIRVESAITVVAIQGSVDGLTSEGLSSALGEQVRSGRTRLVADFGGVEYISSAGLRALLGALKDTRARGGDFRIASVSPDVRRVLELSGFTGILKLFPDVAGAVASFLA